MTVIAADQVVTPTGVLAPGWVSIADGMIIEVASGVPAHYDVRVSGALLPGFVDMHCHGGAGAAFDDPAQASIAADFQLSHGSTSVVASLVSLPVATQAELMQQLRPLVVSNVIAGVHLEGPFLSHARCGAQNPAHLCEPTAADVERLLAAGVGSLRMITIAPELPGAIAAIKKFVAAGVVVAIGHSAAEAWQVEDAIAAGASVVTHLYNGMSAPHPKTAGVADVALTRSELICEVIADGIHVNDYALRIAAGMKPRGLVAITDAIAAAGMPDGEYVLGGLEVEARDGAARLAGTQTLAGSTLTMDRAFDHLLTTLDWDLESAVHATATLPAQTLGFTEVGSIEVGKRADLVGWNDWVTHVWKSGREVSTSWSR